MAEWRRAWVAAVIALYAVAGCRDSGDDKRFELSGRLFVFNYRVATVQYLVTLRPLQPMTEGEAAMAHFENPAGGEAIVVRQKIWPMLDKVTIQSPPLKCVAKDRPYKVSISILGPKGDVLQTIETTMVSSQDQSMLPDAPLVVGPLYDPNPELRGHPDGRLPGARHADCPPPV